MNTFISGTKIIHDKSTQEGYKLYKTSDEFNLIPHTWKVIPREALSSTAVNLSKKNHMLYKAKSERVYENLIPKLYMEGRV